MAFCGSLQQYNEVLVVLFAVVSIVSEGVALDLSHLTREDFGQSSVDFDGPPERATDGDRNTLIHTGSNVGSVEWWRVDLGAFYCLEEITIVNRNNRFAWRLEGANIRAGLSPTYSNNTRIGNEVTAEQASVWGGELRFAADPPVTARYVTVDLYISSSNVFLHFAEIMIQEVTNPTNSHGVSDLALVANPALLGSSGDNDAVIVAYKGPSDIAAGVSFGRQLITGGTNADLPRGSVASVEPPTGCATGILYRFPESDGIDRTGVFYTEATAGGTGSNTRIQAVILPNDASSPRIRPLQRTKTVNVGDSVTIEMQDLTSSNDNYRWSRNNVAITAWDNQLTGTIASVAEADGGIYSCFIDGQENQQKHGFMRLIVRACPAGMWGPAPTCQNTCRRCYNGGICDDKTGACICAPGFSGDSCQLFHGRDVFGQNATHSCSGGTDQHDPACRGRLFCLPDPYGCSCAAGYTGLDCTRECPAGTYGADCKQTCHCASGVTCLQDTGRCNGDCEAQYVGGNCQCSTQSTVLGLRVTVDGPHQLTVSWLPDSCVSGYSLQYALTNKGQCGVISSPQRVVEPLSDVSMTTRSITELKSQSTYSVYVTPHYGSIQGPESTAFAMTPPRANPSSIAPLEATATNSTSVSLSWQEVFCSTHYKVEYVLYNRDGCESINPLPDYTEHCSCTDATTLIGSLLPHSQYLVRVGAYDGSFISQETLSIMTDMAAPTGPPVEIKATGMQKRKLTFSWREPACGTRGGTIIGYNYKLVPISPTSPLQVVKESSIPSYMTSIRIDDLIPYTEYRFEISANTSVGPGPVGQANITRTAEAVPTVPLNVKVLEFSEQSITLVWTEPNPPQGIILHYNIRYDLMPPTDGSTVVQDVTGLTYRVVNLQANKTYFFQVQAETVVGSGPWSDSVSATTTIGEPGPVGNLRATNRTENSITLNWDPPLRPRGTIMSYTVEYKTVSAADYEIEDVQPPYRKDDLTPITAYIFSVSAVNQRYHGEETPLTVFTKPLSNPPAPPTPALLDSEATDTTVTIGLATLNSGDDYVESYVVRVKKKSPESKREVLEENHFMDSPGDYIAAEILKGDMPDSFVVGDKRTYGGYYNAELETGSSYEIRVGSVSRGNESEASVTYSDPVVATAKKPSSSAGLIVGLIFSVLILVALVVIILIYRRRRATPTKDSADGMLKSSGLQLQQKTYVSDAKSSDGYMNNDVIEVVCPPTPKSPKPAPKPRVNQAAAEPPGEEEKKFVPPPPIRIEDLARYIHTKELEGDNGFKADYKALPDEQLHPWTVAAKPENKQKNRYVNVIAYDHSRVVLEPLDGEPNSDYINACYINGYKTKNKFIASQGPNKASLRDIWRMVWQLKVDKIIMLTNPIENGKTKCLQYWSDSGPATYADISVVVDKEDSFLDFTIRDFIIHKVGMSGSMDRNVKQFHYNTWPDMKPPEYPAPLLNFLRLVNSHHNEGRTVVHCSAGVGRTGTFIALDALLKQMAEEGQVDVMGCIYEMRQNRIKMVQTPEQYKFLYDAVLAAAVTGDVSYHSAELRSKLGALKKKSKKSRETGLEKQFQSLSKLSMNNGSESKKSGEDPENVSKNRFPGFIPSDRKRPFLMTRVNDDGNYINATFLSSYRRRNQYITTQTPMPNTVADLWRLVYDHKVNSIVMLNNIDASDQTVCRYWPEDGEQAEFGPLMVELTRTKDSKYITECTFTVMNTKTQSEQFVTQFQFKDWPTDQEVPGSPTGLLALMERTADLPADGKPIVVHCIDGLGRSAVYCTLMSVLEQVKAEEIVDVFQTVHRLRMANENMMYSMDHYATCYSVIQAYLDSSTIYENYNGGTN